MTSSHHAMPNVGDICPICHKPIRKRRKPHLLYDVAVCKKCRYRLASRRQAAFLVDCVLASIPGLLLQSVLMFMGVISPTPGVMVVPFALSFIGVALFPFKDGFSGHSPGKWFCGLQVVHAETLLPINFAKSFRRNTPILTADAVVLGSWFVFPWVAGLASLGRLVFFLIIAERLMNGPRWGDRMAGTRVIWKKYRHRPPFDSRGAFCLECGYNLTGNVSGRCPECGTPVTTPPAAIDGLPVLPPTMNESWDAAAPLAESGVDSAADDLDLGRAHPLG